jgi:diguanylate cyclase (GGDEF)-like protein
MAFKRSHAGSKVPLAVLMRLTVLIFLVSGLVEAQRSSIAGQWWTSRWFWAALATLVVATAGVAWRARDHGYVLRAKVLEAAVIERTADLDKERRRERESNTILEMLVANEPLGTVLEAVLRSVGQHCPDALCAILLKRGDGCQVAAAVDLPVDWLTALRVPHAVPFEVWRMPLSNQHLLRAPPWRIFASQLRSAGPVAVYSRPILQAESQSAAIVLFYRNGMKAEESDARAAETGARMAGLAIEQSRLYDGLHFQANHDSLTGLANRAAFEDRLDRSLREAEVLGQRLAVLFIDLDRFKAVNDAFSHRVGDLFLREVAGRIEKALRPGDTVARIGGDEFTVVVNDVKDAVEVSEIAARILDAIRQPLAIDGHQIEASASVGIAVFPDDGTDAETLQRAADAAMYCAKDLGSDRAQTFAARNETLDRVRMDEALRVALREGYFVVHYQPKVGIDRKLAGLEALVRMNHPAHGRIPPMSFIPVAESTGLIVPLGAWVLDEACRQIAAWELRGLSAVSVAVNVSPVQIRRADFAKSVADCLARHGVAASSLELELTESLLINAAGVTQEQLGALRNIGVKLSIDDFGTGYSSLSYLHRLPVDAIKLDKSFVQSIDTDPLAHRLVHAMVDVGTGLGLSVVAEGVETEGQRAALLAAGCSLMQGFLFSHPKPACEVEEFLRTGHEAPEIAQEIAQERRGANTDLLQMAVSVHAGSSGLVGEPVSA